jgi:hypothetical protein
MEVLMHLSMPQLAKGFGISTEQHDVGSFRVPLFFPLVCSSA